MRTKILIFLSFGISQALCQSKLDHFDFYKIIELYKTEKYQVLANFLSEKGFTNKYFNEEYSLGNQKAIVRGEMKFTKEEPDYLCDFGNPPFKVGVNTSTITFKTQDYPDLIEYNVGFELYDGNCITNRENWPSGRHNGSGILKDKFVNPLVKTYNTNPLFEVIIDGFYNGGTISVTDTVAQYFKTTHGEIWRSRKHNRVNLDGGGISYLKVESFFTTFKYPVTSPIGDYTNPRLTEIPLENIGGVYYLEVSISGKRLKYILDSGASEVSISETTENYLIDIGELRQEDYLPSKVYGLANGTSATYKRVRLRNVRIADVILHNVDAYIANNSAPMLFGKSALDKFVFWKIDNINNRLEVKY
jgi:clan AA aspartic protease (TIGR02281 family)